MGSAIDREEAQAYREHNIVRTAKKMVPDSDGRPTPVARPNNTDQQCQCDKCRAHRRRASVTGVASATKDV